jgi:hypothetical protein
LHSPFAVTTDAVRINGEHFSSEVTRGTSELAESNLQTMTVRNRVRVEQFMHRGVGGDKGESVRQFETAAGM